MDTDLAIIAGLLAAIYGYMKVAMETVYAINDKRDIILDIDENGSRLDRSRKCHLIHSDVIPLVIGLSLFMFVFTGAFLVMGVVIILGMYSDVNTYVAYVFFVASAASIYALWIVIFENYASIKIMKDHVRNMPVKDDKLRPIACCRGICRSSPVVNSQRTPAK